MKTMDDRPKSIFQVANAYSKAAKLINKASSRDTSLILPSQVNAALALELYFKVVYYLDKGKDFKANGRQSHNIYDLFTNLNNSTQSAMRADFKEILENRDMRDILMIESIGHMEIPLNFEENLAAWSDVVVKVRYIYDFLGKVKYMAFFIEIEKVVLKAIQRLNPKLIPS